MPWNKQSPDLYKAVRKYQIHRTIIADHSLASRNAIAEKLKTKFATVFKSGLGRCTRTRATLKLRAYTSPVFKKKRPVACANVDILDKESDPLLAEDMLSHVTYSNVTLGYVMHNLEREAMGAEINSWQLYHLRFGDDISQAERMLADFDRVCRNVGLQRILTKAMFMRNVQVPGCPFSFYGSTTSECFCYVYLGREVVACPFLHVVLTGNCSLCELS
ncbi:unnamed protein product [Heligmosomoides polygyrus]|uniref:DUF4817 domain-containing protein n=1 Tax=Heligmosomoides polygyrus TaxID=6339 RepID=A0A183GPI2_HELPZ|nr:unnamed protein product [Heligmosomoides polygyrus]